MRLAQRPVWPTLCDSRILYPGGDSSRRDGTARQRNRFILGRLDPEFSDNRQLRQRARLQHRTLPDANSGDRRRCSVHLWQRRRSRRTGNRRLDRDLAFDRRGTATSCCVVLPDCADVSVCGPGNDAQGARRLRWAKNRIKGAAGHQERTNCLRVLVLRGRALSAWQIGPCTSVRYYSFKQRLDCRGRWEMDQAKEQSPSHRPPFQWPAEGNARVPYRVFCDQEIYREELT